MKFSEILGHDEVKQRLRSLVDSSRIPHALLLEGAPGSGAFALARAMAQYIHCQHRTPDGDSCGQCPACQQHEQFNHIDTIFSFPIVKKTSTSSAISDDYMADFRELLGENQYMDYEQWLTKLDNINAQPQIFVDEAAELIRKLNFTAHASRYKIVLMWLPEKMKVETANKLLKLIEEPYEDTIFLLASDNSRLILPTIYSRTQRIAVPRYTDEEVARFLLSQYSISDSDAEIVARLAAGNIVEAMSLLSVSKERQTYLNLFMEVMRKAYTRNVGDLRQWADDVAALGREREMKFLDYCAHMIRENFILNLHVPALNCLSQEEMQFSARFSPFINERNVLKLFDQINKAKLDIAANANAKIVNFDLAIKIILLLKA